MQSVAKMRHRDLVPGQFLYCCDDHDHDAVSNYFLKQAFYILTHCCGFMIFGHQCSTSQHHAVYWELRSKCFSSLPVWKRRTTVPKSLFEYCYHSCSRYNRYKGTGHLTCPSSRLAMFPVGSARYCCARLHARLHY